MPLGRVVSLKIRPKGEGKDATLRISEAIPSILSGLSFKRSNLGSAGSIRLKSFWFSTNTASVCSKAASARSFKIALIFSSLSKAILLLAFNVNSNCFFTSMVPTVKLLKVPFPGGGRGQTQNILTIEVNKKGVVIEKGINNYPELLSFIF